MWTGIAASLKGILAVALVGGAATVMVAPALDMAAGRATSGVLTQTSPTPAPEHTDAPELDFGTLLLACLDSFDPDSQACAYAQAKSGLGPEDFRAKVVAKLYGTPEATPEPTHTPDPTPTAEPAHTEAPTPKPTPLPVVAKPKPTTSFDTLLKACLATLDANSGECRRAGEASGLSPADWAAKIASKIAAAEQAQFWTWFEKCLDTRDLGSDACDRAEELSGMTPADFAAKFRSKLAAKDGTDFWTVFGRCLDTRDVTSDVCRQAQELIGFSDADFHAKFERYLAERDAQTSKPSASPTATVKPTATATATAKPTATLDPLFAACGESRDRSSDACLRALVVSGMQPTDFWAKIEARYGHFD